jgi:16S rRNA (adenine1518-N6/adenine1519-N6)-dimethyltransferase
MSIPGLFPGELPTVCGNLPYNLSTPLIFWFLESRAPLGIFMLQKEMARRLWAGPGGKEYGRLSLAVSLFYQASPAFGVSAASFQPRPKVDSVLAILRRKGGPGNGPLSQAALGRLSAAAFHARRKTILNNLSAAYGKERALLALSDLGLDPGARPESIPPEKYHALAMSLEEGLFSHSHP